VTWVQTYTGRMVNLLHPLASAMRMDDIAHALANQCRFNGHCRRFYSVAQHSVLAAGRVGRGLAARRLALLHDAAEAYTGDIVTPLKEAVPILRSIEADILEAIHDRFCVYPDAKTAALVRLVDGRLLATECRELMATPPAPWADLAKPFDDEIDPWEPNIAREAFWHAAVGMGLASGTPAWRGDAARTTNRLDHLPELPDRPANAGAGSGGAR
jgi:uncharacterized protein